MVTDAAWVWVPETGEVDPVALRRFAVERGVREAAVSVPWTGPDAAVRAVVDELRAAGIGVGALGGTPQWADRPTDALQWAARAHSGQHFSWTQLDVEPWTLPDWDERPAELLAGLGRVVVHVRSMGFWPVRVDLTPWLAEEHPDGFRTVVRGADLVTLMSYATTSPAVLGVSAAAREALGVARRRYRLAVNTVPDPADPGSTFFGGSRAELAQVTGEVSRQLAHDALHAGIAVHDLSWWSSMRS